MQQINNCKCKENSWEAILDEMPPSKPRLRVTGVCTCPTGGFKASLKKAASQGINPNILILELSATAPSGIVNQMVTDYDVRYEEENSPRYTDVTIVPCEITIPVEVVS